MDFKDNFLLPRNEKSLQQENEHPLSGEHSNDLTIYQHSFFFQYVPLTPD